MAIINDPDLLNQGTSTAVADMRFGSSSGATTTITSAGTSLPAIAAGEYFEVRGALDPENDGLYLASGTPTTGSITADKVGGSVLNPVDNASDSTNAVVLGTTGTASEKSVFFDVIRKEIWLIADQGNMSDTGGATDNGVIMQYLYSFTKEEWKADSTLIPHPFPFTAITPEQFELANGWTFHSGAINGTEARKLVRTGGWRELKADGTINREYAGVISLGTFEDSTNDKAYYQQGDDFTDTAAAQDFTFFGPVNEAVNTYDYTTTSGFDSIGDSYALTANTITRPSGSFITDGYRVGGKVSIVTATQSANLGTNGVPKDFTITDVTALVLTVTETINTTTTPDTALSLAVNNRNVLNIFLREPANGGDTVGKTFGFSDLGAIGVSEVDNKVFRFPLTNASDLKIETADTSIDSNSDGTADTGVFANMAIRYFSQAFSRDVDTVGSPADFGIVVDVGTFSGVDGTTTNGGSSLTTAEAGIPTDGTYNGGTLTIHEGNHKGSYTIGTISLAGTVPITGSFPATAPTANASFTLQRATPISATTQQIYEFVKWSLRQNVDINATSSGEVVGSTATDLLFFVGDALTAGSATVGDVRNPIAEALTGVIIEGFSSADTNTLTFVDNSENALQFPFISSGTITFNDNLVDDADAEFWMFYKYTKQFAVSNAVTLASTGGSGALATFTTTTGGQVELPNATLASNDYLNITGFANEANNGIWRVEAVTDANTGGFTAYKVDGAVVVAESSVSGIVMEENPLDSPQAIIVEDADGNPIQSIGQPANTIASTVSFDFAYTTNVQGGRPLAGANNSGGIYDAKVVVRAIGLNTGQFVESAVSTIGKTTGITIAVVSGLERNYSDPA